MEQIEIRKARKEDAYEIAAIHVKTWQCAYKGQLSDEYLQSLSVEKRAENWQKYLSDPETKVVTYVALLDNNIIGFCNVGPNTDKEVASDIGELYAIYVDPDFQGKGVGRQLVTTGLETLEKEGYKKATLWVLDSNEKTQKFYEYLGWQVEGKKRVEERQHGDLNEIRYIVDLTKKAP